MGWKEREGRTNEYLAIRTQNTLANHSLNQAGRGSLPDASPVLPFSLFFFSSASEHIDRNHYLEFRVMFDGRGSVRLVGQKDLVYAIVVLFHRMARVVPSVYSAIIQ